MDDDASTTESDDPTTEYNADEEPEEPMADGAAAEAAYDGAGGGSAGMLGAIEIPSTGRMLVGIGGAAMALSTLFSWVKVGVDSFPNIAGVGVSTFGVGLAVFLVGLSLLLRSKSVAATLGMALGAFGATLVFIVLIGTDRGILGFGAWLGLVGSAVAVLGALHQAFESSGRPTLESQPISAALGAALAVAASFWLDWVPNSDFWINRWPGGRAEPLSGMDFDVLFGLPILILAGIALVFTVELMSVPLMVLEGRRQALLMITQAAGVAIMVIAGANVLGGAIVGYDVFGSGPLVALVGGVMVTRSIRQA